MMRYNNYNKVSIEWLHELPSQWKTIQIKQLKEGEDTLFIDGDWIESHVITDKGIRYLTTGNVGPGYYKEQGSGFITEETFEKLNCTEVFPGDLIISRLNEPIGRACIIPDLGYRIVTAVDNVILRPKKPFDIRYLMHLMNSREFSAYTSLISRGATMKRISRGLLGSIKIPFPSGREQANIASFLDKKTMIIDSILAKKKQLLILLKEKKEAVINESVTKGLHSSTPMKDSGVNWLGEIPQHWVSLPFRRICSLSQGLQIQISERYFDEIENSFEYITTKSIHNPNDPKQYILNPNSSVICDVDDVLMGRTGNTGEVVTNVKGVFHNNFFKIDFDRSKLNKEFLVNYLNYTGLQNTILLVAGTTTIPDINHGAFLELHVTLPPYNEQLEIVKFIKNKTVIIDRIMEYTKQLIEKLQNYRQSLVSEGVTGKIDVRDWHLTTKDV